jgi:phosphoribosylamine--glycine ligase
MAKEKILVVGGGGREHALAWRCAQEGYETIVAPGNDGIAQHARCESVKVGDHEGLVALAKKESVGLTIVGPEQPLVDGLADAMRAADVPTLGPSARAAELEGSKAAAKAFMDKFSIPTAGFETVSDLESGLAAVRKFDTPPVVKASGLAAGKGVVVPESFEEAEQAVRDCMEAQRFGTAGSTVVLEERLLGQEVSFFAITDGSKAATLEASQDHKRIGDGDTGPNTGGMGAYAPAPVCSDEVRERILSRVVTPTLAGLREEGRPFNGILFLGLMVDEAGNPKVIEYNVRFGDPEAQPLMFGLKDDIVPSFLAAARGTSVDARLAGRPSATVVLASAGYPATSTKGSPIIGLDQADALDDVQIFHAGTKRGPDGRWQSNGGRVLGICARGDDLRGAVGRAYEAAGLISMEGGQMRKDIAWRAL